MKYRYHLSAFILFILFTSYITFPLIFHMNTLVTGFGDELVISWIQNWIIHALGNHLNIFDANTFFPYHNVLAYSDALFTTSILAIPALLIGKEPIVTFNFTLLLSLTMLGVSVYALSYYFTKSFFASLLSGTLVIFSPAVLSFYIHLQILFVAFIPLSILFFLLFLDKHKTRYLLVSLSFFLLQVYNSILPGYFICFSYLIIFGYYGIYQKRTRQLITKKNFTLCLCTVLLLIPLAVPYYQVSHQFNYVRDIRDAVHFALQPEDLLYPSAFTHVAPLLYMVPFNQHSQNNEFKPGYLGIVFTFLAVYAVLTYITRYRKRDIYLNSLMTIGLFGLVLSLGPVLHLNRETVHIPFPIPLPYAVFYYILPGFAGFRNSARWEMLFIICSAITAAYLLSKALGKFSVVIRNIVFILLIIGCILEFKFPFHFETVPLRKDFPQVYSWIASTPKDAAIIELPIYNWNMSPYTQRELFRQYYSTAHFHKTVNGYSGFSPPPWQDRLYLLMSRFPDPKTLAELRRIKVRYIIIHSKEYDLLKKDGFAVAGTNITDGLTIRTQLKRFSDIVLIHQFGDDYVYEIK